MVKSQEYTLNIRLLVGLLRRVEWRSGLLRITYHNGFHQGAQTSFLEMVLKIPEACPLVHHHQPSAKQVGTLE